MTFSENLMSLTDMKKIAAIMACLSAGLSNYTLAGVTTLTGNPMYVGKPLSVAIQCSGKGQLNGECGIWIEGAVGTHGMGATGVCTGTGRYEPRIKILGGGNPNGTWISCGWKTDSTYVQEWELNGVIDIVLTGREYDRLPQTFRIRPYVDVVDETGTTATFRGVLPDGRPLNDDMQKHKLRQTWFGTNYYLQKTSWANADGPVRVELKYPDSILMRENDTVTVLETNHPVFVTAQTDLKNVVIKDRHGQALGVGKTLVTGALSITNTEQGLGVYHGLVRLDVSLV